MILPKTNVAHERHDHKCQHDPTDSPNNAKR